MVYVLDVGSYQLKGVEATARLERMKLAVLESLTKLSANSYFNLVLCWNLREAHALGKRFSGQTMKISDMQRSGLLAWVQPQIPLKREGISFTRRNFIRSGSSWGGWSMVWVGNGCKL